MNILIIYDSLYGNTEKIAQAVAEALTPSAPSNVVKIIRADEAKISDIESIDLLIIGSPTHGGRPSPAIKAFLDKIPADGLKNIKVTAFDTHLKIFILKIFGYAAGRIVKELQGKGGQLVAAPAGFIVSGTKGPLGQNEMERAAGWAKEILKNNQ
ncbi:MAG: flavodoxin family protein [Patescibacteria group bacterium]